MKKIEINEVKYIIKESSRIIMTEIDHLAEHSNITVCSARDFRKIMNDLGLDDSNVEKYRNLYAMIEIGDGETRIESEFNSVKQNQEEFGTIENYRNDMFYFKQDHRNVLRLSFDDNAKEHIDKKTNVKYANYKDDHNGTNIRYDNPTILNDETADKTVDFIKRSMALNPDIKFIIHCREGRSRSAILGYLITFMKNPDNFDEYMKDYFLKGDNGEIERDDKHYLGRKSQFATRIRASYNTLIGNNCEMLKTFLKSWMKCSKKEADNEYNKILKIIEQKFDFKNAVEVFKMIKQKYNSGQITRQELISNLNNMARNGNTVATIVLKDESKYIK